MIQISQKQILNYTDNKNVDQGIFNLFCHVQYQIKQEKNHSWEN